MKKLLITGGSYAEIPLIEEAQQQGWFVITTGTNRDGLGHQFSDQYIPGDYSDMEFIRHLAESERVEGIVSACNEFSYLSTAYACEMLGLPGHDSLETAKIIHHKHRFRFMVSSLGLRAPKAILCDTMQKALAASVEIGFPLVVKPTDLFSGNGIHICREKSELEASFQEAKKRTRQSSVLLEEYISGDQHGASMLLKNHHVVCSFFDDEQYYINPYMVAGASSSIIITPGIISKLCNDVEKIAQHLHLIDGLFHVQFIVENSTEPVMIDPSRRSPGDLYVSLAKHATGVNYPAEIVKAETGIALADHYPVVHKMIARECIMASRPGIIREVHIPNEIEKHIISRMIWGKPGDIVQNAGTYKAGIVIMEFDNQEQLHETAEHFHELVTIEMQ